MYTVIISILTILTNTITAIKLISLYLPRQKPYSCPRGNSAIERNIPYGQTTRSQEVIKTFLTSNKQVVNQLLTNYQSVAY